MVVPVVYAPVASFVEVGACAFYEKIALYRACLVGKCLQSERLTDARGPAVYGCRLGMVDVVDEKMSVSYSW